MNNKNHHEVKPNGSQIGHSITFLYLSKQWFSNLNSDMSLKMAKIMLSLDNLKIYYAINTFQIFADAEPILIY
ncbi:hypothetical protein BpHYR1_053633 [Brachionus plicatilis]|uniref:Uncharacterized protein n=1 Tax=Brachionus plicatilis TaxID=10195 RepID=A0A3M7PEE7_BRAPC|nr:hypothetical protein BpHYR1_053633 [Brachionus plicatilis]